MELEEYKSIFGGRDDSAPGWDSIDTRLCEVYGNQTPQHWGTTIKYMIGGPDPLDGISCYQCTDGGMNHLHLCSYGFSSLYYDEESVGKDFSKYGFEMTFRLASPLPPPKDSIWVCNLFQNLARYVFKSGNWFGAYHWIPANGPICGSEPTELVGLVFLIDPVLGTIKTPHGRVDFIQAFGVNGQELGQIKTNSMSCQQLIETHRINNPLLVTNLLRKTT